MITTKHNSIEASLEFDDGDEELMLDVVNYKSHGEHEEQANRRLLSRIRKLIDELEFCKRSIENRYTFAHCYNCKHGHSEKNGKLYECWFSKIYLTKADDHCDKWHDQEDY